MKKCFKCNVVKPLEDYYKHLKMSDGRLNKCKNCTKEDTRKRTLEITSTPEGLQKERERNREKYHRLGYKDKHKPSREAKKEIMDRYKNKYPEKDKARNASQRIKKQNDSNQLHHWSYKQEHWKDVIEMSVEHHNLLHRHIIYDADHLIYRRVDNMSLLESKQSHIDLLNSLL